MTPSQNNKAVLTGEHFINGDIACAEGAIACGCSFYAAYPITPATEVAERMAYRLPELGGIFIQMEDEIASIAAVLGASWGGAKSMTATSGPGFSLMMENIGLGAMLETPCVIANIQRGGPSTGLPTLVGQSDIMQARWGSHGDYEIIALSVSSPQECFDFTIKAFNLSEKYRVPVILLGDEKVGHMTEKVVIPPAEDIEIAPRRLTQKDPGEYLPFEPGEDMIPDMAELGEGHRIHATGLTHDEKGYPAMNADAQQILVKRLVDKIRENTDDISEVEERDIDDADIVIVSYGISARTSVRAIEMARERGIKVGLLKLITVWPFPEKKIRELASHVKALIVPELNYGQIALEVERCAGGKTEVVLVPHMGGEIHKPETIFNEIQRIAQ